MTAPLPERPSADEGDAAHRLDTAIDELLAGRSDARVADDDPLVGTARVLGARLPRLHPRFGFEEQLARRLRADSADDHGDVLDFPLVDGATDLSAAFEQAWRPGRWSVIGAVASGISVAITLAGAVFVVIWRRARGSDASESPV